MSGIKLTPLGKDVVVERLSDSEAFKTSIYLRDDDDTNIQRYRILKVGPDVTEVKEDDIIFMSWSNITPPFTQDGKKVGITNEKEILGVVEEGSYDD